VSTIDDEGLEPLPLVVSVTQAFNRRLPTQRMVDLLAKAEPTAGFAEVAEHQPFRLVAFRALLRDYPLRDPTSLWLHAYDVEVAIEDVDPTGQPSQTAGLPSVGTGD
jgi:hypothetical protein